MRREKIIQEIIENLSKCQRANDTSLSKVTDLPRAQIGMLFMLSHHKVLQVKQIADYLGISKSAVSQLLEPLSLRGLIVRQADSQDRRIARFRLTSAGARQLNKIQKSKHAGFRNRLSGLNKEELEQLAILSRKLVNRSS